MQVDLRESWRIGDVEIPIPPRACADGRSERPGLPPPGAPLRRRARLLGDGQLRRALAQERAHARLPAHRRRRASARRADLRRGACRHGRGRANGRGRGRGPRRHQLRLPGAQGDEDRRGRALPRGAGTRLRDRRRRRERDLAARLGEDAPRARERIANVPRDRPAARRGRRRVADAPPALGEADVHRARPTTR